MFGHQDDHKDDAEHDESQEDTAAQEVAPVQADDNQQDGGSDAPAEGKDDGAGDSPDDPGQNDGTPVNDDEAWQHPGEPIDDSPGQISDIIGPAGGAQKPAPPMPLNARDLSDDDDAKTPHELIDIKQKALNELMPLMGQLDQTPEDKFRTLLMIIQASDNQDMIKQAYEAADDIKDEKVRAQALLDLVNEINYFTQHPAPGN